MIKDLYLLLDIELLLHKKIIVWGIGENGKILIEQLIQAGISDKNLLLCDSDERKQGKKYKGWNIFSPEHIIAPAAPISVISSKLQVKHLLQQSRRLLHQRLLLYHPEELPQEFPSS